MFGPLTATADMTTNVIFLHQELETYLHEDDEKYQHF